MASNDAPWTIGSAKELVECSARVVATAKGTITPSNADFADVVNDAHLALDRQAGPSITRACDVRAIAQNAKKIVFSVKDIRNDFGTGDHAEVRSIADEMVLALPMTSTTSPARLQRNSGPINAAQPP